MSACKLGRIRVSCWGVGERQGSPGSGARRTIWVTPRQFKYRVRHLPLPSLNPAPRPHPLSHSLTRLNDVDDDNDSHDDDLYIHPPRPYLGFPSRFPPQHCIFQQKRQGHRTPLRIDQGHGQSTTFPNAHARKARTSLLSLRCSSVGRRTELKFIRPFQGSGKGTLSGRLMDKYDISFLSTGDVLRQHIKNKTEIGKKAESIVAAGGQSLPCASFGTPAPAHSAARCYPVNFQDCYQMTSC